MADHLPIHHFIFGSRQGRDRLGQQAQILDAQGDLAGAGAGIAARLDEVARSNSRLKRSSLSWPRSFARKKS
jgi:hypothetical protein